MPSNIRFNAADHSYWIGDTQLQSVTTLLKSVVPEFDSDGVSKRCAARDGITQEEVLAQWAAKGEIGRARGTMTHSYIEEKLEGTHDPIMDAVNIKSKEMVAFDAAWAVFLTNLKAEIISQEIIVGNERLGVAGRVDLIISVMPEGVPARIKCVFDWKTGKFEKQNRYENLLSPFDDLPNCEYVKYSLQTSLYRLLLELETGEQYGDSYLVHLMDTGTYRVYKATDFRPRLLAWLESRGTVPAAT